MAMTWTDVYEMVLCEVGSTATAKSVMRTRQRVTRRVRRESSASIAGTLQQKAQVNTDFTLSLPSATPCFAFWPVLWQKAASIPNLDLE